MSQAHIIVDLMRLLDQKDYELQLYRDAALYDPDMSGQAKFKGWNRSALDRARAVTEARIEKENS